MPVKTLLSALEKDAREGQLVAVVRVLNSTGGSTTTAVVRPADPLSGFGDERITREISAALGEMIRKGSEADLIEVSDAEGNPVRVVVELVRDKFHIVIFGAGHVGHAVA